jgi:hypothetical protein
MPVGHNILCQIVIKWMVIIKCDSAVHYLWLCEYKKKRKKLSKQTSWTKFKTKWAMP